MSKQTMTKKCRTHPFIDDYLDKIESGEIRSSEKIKKARLLIYRKLDNEDVFIDTEKIDKAKELIEKYFGFELFDWELCVLALIHCYYKSDDTVVFDEFFIVMGRGNGKNGFISPIAWYLTTHYHGIKGYNVDIVANNEDQAKTSFNDVYEILDDHWSKLKKFFYRSKTSISNLRTKSYIEYNTANADTKDGKRSACLIFDEVHGYEKWNTISVFQSGFGKRKHSRTFYITTNGDVREGVLDDLLETADRILEGEIDDLRTLPLIYMLDEDEQVDDEDNWVMANPSYYYLPTLRKEIKSDYVKMKYQPHKRKEFFTKRMNRPRSDADSVVVDVEILKAAKKPFPDLTGWDCVVGIDYASLNDLASVNLHFRDGENRYDINHSWLCLKSADLPRLRPDWSRWVDDGYLTTVDDDQILPQHLCNYIKEQQEKYNILAVALDNFKFTTMSEKLGDIGFSRDAENLWIVTVNDIKRNSSLIDYCFANKLYHWGNNSPLLWSTNNTKKIKTGDGGEKYGKIEPKSRKTDPFMALVASMCIENRLTTVESGTPEFKVFF